MSKAEEFKDFIQNNKKKLHSFEVLSAVLDTAKLMAIADMKKASSEDELVKAKNRWIGRDGVITWIGSYIFEEIFD